MPRTTYDIRVEVTLKNNHILERMEDMNIGSNAKLCRLMEWPKGQAEVGRLINMKQPARLKTGEWCEGANRLADFFHCDPDDLFSVGQQWEELEWNHICASLTFEETQRMTEMWRPYSPHELVEESQLREVVSKMLSTLTPREERVIRLRFGFNADYEELDLDSVAALFKVTRERIRQIEAKALRKCKHPSRSSKLRSFLS